MGVHLQETERAGCDVVWLDVWEHNPRAIAFYRKWGFEQVGTQTFQLGEDVQNDWLIVRSVSPGALPVAAPPEPQDNSIQVHPYF